jgi:uncharacterized membrane protein
MSRLLSPSAYTELHQATNRTFDPYMPILVVSSLAGGVVLLILSPWVRSTAGWLAVMGFLRYAAVLAIGLPTCVRINKLVAHWSIQSPPSDWTLYRARWIRFHILRTLFSVPGLACYILAVLLLRR